MGIIELKLNFHCFAIILSHIPCEVKSTQVELKKFLVPVVVRFNVHVNVRTVY